MHEQVHIPLFVHFEQKDLLEPATFPVLELITVYWTSLTGPEI